MASIIQSKLNLVPGAAPGGILPRVRVSQGDAEERILQFELFDGTTAADMTDVVGCYIGGTKPDGNGFTVSCTLASNVATAVLTDQATVLAGSIRCKLYLLSATGSVRSASFDFDVDPDPLADAGTSDTDITAIVQAAAMYAREAEESAEAAAASEEGAATAGAAAGQAAAEVVAAGKLDKVGGDSKDVVTTFTSQDNAADTGLVTASGQEVSVATVSSGETQSSLFNKITGLALNLRRTINAVKAIWTGVSDDWDPNGHSYSAYDMVWYGTHLYKCKLAHTSSGSITPLNTTYWEDTTVTREISSLNSNYAKLTTYSTSEKLTGEVWTDGKPIYQKTFDVVLTPSVIGSKIQAISNALASNVKMIVSVKSFYRQKRNGSYLNWVDTITMNDSLLLQGNAFVFIEAATNTLHIGYQEYNGFGTTAAQIVATVQYTKLS